MNQDYRLIDTTKIEIKNRALVSKKKPSVSNPKSITSGQNPKSDTKVQNPNSGTSVQNPNVTLVSKFQGRTLTKIFQQLV